MTSGVQHQPGLYYCSFSPGCVLKPQQELNRGGPFSHESAEIGAEGGLQVYASPWRTCVEGTSVLRASKEYVTQWQDYPKPIFFIECN